MDILCSCFSSFLLNETKHAYSLLGLSWYLAAKHTLLLSRGTVLGLPWTSTPSGAETGILPYCFTESHSGHCRGWSCFFCIEKQVLLQEAPSDTCPTLGPPCKSRFSMRSPLTLQGGKGHPWVCFFNSHFSILGTWLFSW